MIKATINEINLGFPSIQVKVTFTDGVKLNEFQVINIPVEQAKVETDLKAFISERVKSFVSDYEFLVSNVATLKLEEGKEIDKNGEVIK